jgi:hypothetical protein
MITFFVITQGKKSSQKKYKKNFRFFLFCIYENLYNFHVLLLTVCHQNEKNQSNPGKSRTKDILYHALQSRGGHGGEHVSGKWKGGDHSQRLDVENMTINRITVKQ